MADSERHISDSLDARAKRVFDDVIDLDHASRPAQIDLACAGDDQLRARVEVLLAAAAKDDVFLSDPTIGAARTDIHAAAAEQPGAFIGPYKILERIGEGGFGSVFMAEQSSPVRRRVALKIIKLGMDTRAVVARFEQERQALAVMDHPNIAKVFDAGATDAGRPYFVMELVKGEPITTYSDAANLSIPERLVLFAQVCRAVQHAHTKGIIHRDLKPTNILVSTQDGRPFCKVIDFGIAKATQHELIEKTIFTEFRQLIGTPAYMSPEQAAAGLDIDTRSDVYSLGVLLYELLAGATPFDPEALRSAAFGEIQRIIREVDPPTPSTRLSQSQATLANVAALRRTEPRKLGAMVRGELDWIVMKALDKDRARRYESPGNFALDVERYLAGEPVQAAPPGATYRLKKFVRRHRFGMSASGLVALALLVGLTAALWQARIAARERDAARKSAADALDAKREAETRGRQTEQVAEFQSSQLADIDVEQMGKRLRDDLLADAKSGMERAGLAAPDIAARQDQLARLLADVNPTNIALKTLDSTIFERALKAMNEQFKDQPLLKSRLLQTLAETMTSLGLLEHAAAPQAEALAIRRKLLGDRNPETLYSIYHMGALMQARGKLPEAEVLVREAVRNMPAVLGEDGQPTLDAKNTLGVVLQLEGKLDEAEPFYRESFEHCQRLFGPDHVDTLAALNNLGFLLFARGNFVEAESRFRDALVRVRRIKGDDDPDTLSVMNNLASMIQRTGQLTDAEPLFREALERSRRTLGEDSPGTLQFANNMAFLLYLEGRLSESEPLTRDTLARRRRVLRDDHWDTLQSINNMGLLLQAQGKLDEAEPFFREALARRQRVLGDTHPATLQSICNLGVLLRERGKLADAEPLLRKALQERHRTLGDDHTDTLESITSMARLLAAQGRPVDAEREFRRAVDLYARKLGEHHPDTARAQCELAIVLSDQGRYADAEKYLLQAEPALRGGTPAQAQSHKRCAQALATLYERWENTDPGHGYAAKAAKWRSD